MVAKDFGIAKDRFVVWRYCVCLPLANLYSQESLKTLLTDALSKTDVVVTSGGVSMGEKVWRF